MYYSVYLGIGCIFAIMMIIRTIRIYNATHSTRRLRVAGDLNKDKLPSIREFLSVLREKDRRYLYALSIALLVVLPAFSTLLYILFWPLFLVLISYAYIRQKIINIVVNTVNDLFRQ
jgi:hypothetical protein